MPTIEAVRCCAGMGAVIRFGFTELREWGCIVTTGARWTFITNHGLVLSFIFHNPRSTAREIANYIGVTERTTHKIISDLEVAGYIERRKEGRRNVYDVNPTLPLRHHTKQDVMVDELLEALTTKNPDELLIE